jgi:D-alanyl-D-alanine carboxypeptidase/D-alanyl-D-alanine-endopeptidase (penicillin-binding protein 4)
MCAAGPGTRIAAFLDGSPVARTSFWGIRILDLAQNRIVFERDAHRLFVPASNAKLFSTALALARLGPDYRFQTRVLADRTPGEDGCVESMRLVGGGDPNLSGRPIPYSRSAPLGDSLAAIEDLAAEVAAHGVRCVSADIIGDDTAYVWQPLCRGLVDRRFSLGLWRRGQRAKHQRQHFVGNRAAGQSGFRSGPDYCGAAGRIL